MRRVAAALALGALLGGCGAPQDALKGAAVGVIVPLSGPDAEAGRQVVEGLRLAAARTEASLEILPRDSYGSPGVAFRRLQELTDEDRVVAIVGGWSAATARAVASGAAARGVPFLALSPMTVPDAAPSAPILALHRLASLGSAGARFVREDLGAPLAAIARLPGLDAADVLARSFRREFEARGGRIAWDESFDPESRPDPVALPPGAGAVWIVGGGALAGRVSDFGAAVEGAVFVLPEGWPSDGLAPLAASGRPVRWVSFYAASDTGRVAREFEEACRGASVPPTTAVAMGWDAMLALQGAARTAGASRAGLAEGMATHAVRDGVTGSSALGGGPESPAVSAVTSDGQHFLRRVEIPLPAAPPRRG